jgi:carbon monoxide dehydrogenase subunit G
MKVNGKATLNAPLEKVYEALNNPAVLVRTIPGCEKLEQVGQDAYRMTVTAGVASIKGSYIGDVRLTDQHAPTSFILRAKGAGAPGTVSADVQVTLENGTGDAAGTTLLTYAADAVVGGAVGGVGQRVLSGVAKKTAGEFFAAVDQLLNAFEDATVADTADGAAEPAPAGVAAHAPAVAAPAAGAPSGVFLAPAKAAAPPALAGGSFLQGAVFGALIALVGVAVGGAIAGRRQ